MEIEQHIWGLTPEGEAIVLYTLRSADGAEVRLSNLGASIVGAQMPDRTGRMDEVVLGYRNPLDYMGDAAWMGKTLGRVAGPIGYGRMSVAGQEHRLEINSGVSHLHGGCKGFGNRLWESRVETNRVVMSLLSPEGDAGYPGELAVEAIFDFDDHHALEITYLARTDRTTPVNLTNNLYLNLAGDGSGTIRDHELHLHAGRVLELDEWQLPTGRMCDVAGTPLDFTSFRPLGEGIDAPFGRIRDFGGYDHPFPIDGWRSGILTEAATLREPRSGRCVEVLTSQPGVVLDTGNHLSGGCPENRFGGRYADHAGVALECRNFPDAVNRPEFPSPLLAPDELYCQKTVYRFGIC